MKLMDKTPVMVYFPVIRYDNKLRGHSLGYENKI